MVHVARDAEVKVAEEAAVEVAVEDVEGEDLSPLADFSWDLLFFTMFRVEGSCTLAVLGEDAGPVLPLGIVDRRFVFDLLFILSVIFGSTFAKKKKSAQEVRRAQTTQPKSTNNTHTSK